MFSTLFLLLIFTESPKPERNPCEENLDAARTHYDMGRFQQAERLLEACADSEERVQVLYLLVKTQLATDRFSKALETLKLLLIAAPEFQLSHDDPRRLQLMLSALREGVRLDQKVVTVSKSLENLREAPATAVVLTRQEILRRGYLDLAAILHDLPGFDIQTGSGDIYSNFNQRGYRAANDRSLFLVDGVESNDLWRGPAYISRQYPLSNIDRLEIIYGPASTMYGSNAFVGVINLITKKPEDYVTPGNTVGFYGMVGGGQWQTHYFDTTVAWKHPARQISFSLTTRIYQSDDPDLSGYAVWDYDPAFYDALDYSHLSTDQALVERARRLDQAAMTATINGVPVGFDDFADDRMVHGRLRLGDLLIGFMKWRRDEGHTSWYTDNLYAGASNGTHWVPEHGSIWMEYETGLTEELNLDVFARFKKHLITDRTIEIQLINYAGGSLDIEDLTRPEPVPSHWNSLHYNQNSRQFRVESRLTWRPHPNFDLVSGVEFRQSLLQGDYMLQIDCPDRPNELCPVGNRQDQVGQFFDVLDVGIYSQASWRFRPRWKVVGGGRLDRNRAKLSGGIFSPDPSTGVPEPEGYGRVFNPRLALVHQSRSLTIKTIYAEAFKDATQWERYATSPGFRDLPNPGLEPEKARSFEIAAHWVAGKHFQLDLSAYRSRYSGGVTPQRVPFGDGTTLQNKAIGSLDIKGVQANLEFRLGRTSVYANYNYTNPISRNFLQSDGSKVDVRVADIAPHHINAGISRPFFEHWHANLRSNWSDSKRAGPGTTTPANSLTEVDGYWLFHLSLTYENKRLAGFLPQILIQNLTDSSYVHPGVSSADGVALASFIPQPGRSVFLRFSYEY